MSVSILEGDCLVSLRTLPDGVARCCVTSPPYYGLRDYGHEGQIGLESSVDEYVAKLVAVFREVHRALADDGTLWVNLGDSYAAARGGTTPPAETLAGGQNGWMPDGSRVNRDRKDGYNPTRDAATIGLKHKDLIGIPWRVAFALQADGWYLRQDIIWNKPNPMPESVKDRCTKAHEYVFLLSKRERYYFDAEAIKEDSVGGSKGKAASFKRDGSKRGLTICSNSPMPTHRDDRPDVRYDGPQRNARSVWPIATRPFKGAHFAVFPEALAERCIRAGSAVGDTVLDPFGGSGTTGAVAVRLGREATLCELNPAYAAMARERIANVEIPLPMEDTA